MNKIDLCKKCTKRKFDTQQGIICGLTNEKPIFEDNCPDFEIDETVKELKTQDLRPNEKRAKAILLLIWIMLGLEVVSLISEGLQYNLLQKVSNGGEITIAAANANDLRVQIIGIIYMIAYIISGIAFIMWFRRAYFNLHQKVLALSFSEGWAAGSWFVPIINLYRPFQIMKELYLETHKILLNKGLIKKESLSIKPLGLWWTFWIISGILGQFIFRYSMKAETIDELTISTVASIISNIIGIPLALITIKIIKDYSKVEPLLRE